MATILNSEKAKEVNIGDKATITLSNGNEIMAEIKYKAEQEDEKILLVFDIQTLTEELIQYRRISFNITWWSQTGLKVPNTSIIEEENGLNYVIVKKNEATEKYLVKVKQKGEKYSIIGNYKAEELNSIGIDSENYIKIAQFDTILLYPIKKNQ